MKNPHLFFLAAILGVVTSAASGGEAAPTTPPPQLATIGVYIWRDTPSMHGFWKDCGYNLTQFCDIGWHFEPARLPELYATMAGEVAACQADGFKTDVILFSNIAQWMGPGPSTNPVGDRFNPRDAKALETRLGYLRQTVRALKHADSFTFFAGDPGGAPPEIGTANVDDWIAMARKVRALVAEEAPQAGFNVNTWAITQWKDFGISAWHPNFWQNENEITRHVLSVADFVGPDCGIQFPLHNYYRSLSFAAHAREELKPELYPLASDVAPLANRGTARIWGWPYFLVDEADDGYIGTVWRSNQQAQAETRYLHHLMDQTRGLGLNGLIANFSYKGYLAETLNTYAFARLAMDATVPPEKVLDEYAAILATPETASTLGQILRFIENHSTWEMSLPPENRLPKLATPLTSGWMALRSLATVHPNPKPGLRLPEPPADYLARLRDQVQLIAARESIPEGSTTSPDGGEVFSMIQGNWAGDSTTSGSADGIGAAFGLAADRACVAISTSLLDGMSPPMIELPLEVLGDYPTGTRVRLTWRKDAYQTTAAGIYWNAERLGTVNAQGSPDGMGSSEFRMPAPVEPGVHVLRLVSEEQVPQGGIATTFIVDCVELLPQVDGHAQD